jgi:ketosteroid isomerase-like protein
LNASPEEDAKTVAALDTKYQAAVKANDAQTMDQILADDFVLVTGRGSVFSKADLLDSARKKEATYERQDEEPGTQKIRVWGDTAVVTALLWRKIHAFVLFAAQPKPAKGRSAVGDRSCSDVVFVAKPRGSGRTTTGGTKQNFSCHLSPGPSLAAWKTSYGTAVEGAWKVHAESLH